jgi:hypothetical protein
MAACVRIYTQLGKENCITVDSYVVSRITANSLGETTSCYVTFQDDRESTLTQIERIVEAGQPCNMHIRYEDSDVETVCTLDGCKLVGTQIVCEDHDTKIIGWVG